MVYVVERDLAGLSSSDLLRGLYRSILVLQEQGAPVSGYLDSTIVLNDEACSATSKARPRPIGRPEPGAGLPFDRIVRAVTVKPKGEVDDASAFHSCDR